MTLLDVLPEYRGDHAYVALRPPAALLFPGHAARLLTPVLEGKEHVKQCLGNIEGIGGTDAGHAAKMPQTLVAGLGLRRMVFD
jgi:hypothetical protein